MLADLDNEYPVYISAAEWRVRCELTPRRRWAKITLFSSLYSIRSLASLVPPFSFLIAQQRLAHCLKEGNNWVPRTADPVDLLRAWTCQSIIRDVRSDCQQLLHRCCAIETHAECSSPNCPVACHHRQQRRRQWRRPLLLISTSRRRKDNNNNSSSSEKATTNWLQL